MQNNNWANQAIEIAERFGALIVPLISKKQPLTKLNPTKTANKDLPARRLPSSDPDIIREWATKCPGYGVVPSDKLFILDVDIKENQNGKKSLKFLVDHGLPTDTFTVKSPSGGVHFYLSKPAHFEPMPTTGAFINIKFDNPDTQSEWDQLQESSGCESTGLDTRYGWSYVAGPESDFDGDRYELLCNSDLGHMPSSMAVGFKGKSVKKDNPKKAFAEVKPGSIKQDRNTHAANRTFQLALQRLPDDHAKVIVSTFAAAYNNDDGDAPVFDDIWDMYIRATEKIADQDVGHGDDILEQLITKKIYLVKGERVIDVHNSRNSLRFQDFKSAMDNQHVMVEVGGDMKPRNPADVWRRSPDRLTAMDTIYNIAHPYGMVKLDDDDDHCFFNEFVPPAPTSASDVPYTDNGRLMFDATLETFRNVLTDPDDYKWFMKWTGSLLFMPTFRPAWHWHIFSKGRGIGKDITTTVISSLYGSANVRHLGIEAFQDTSNVEFFNSGLLIFSDFKRISEKRGDVLAKFKALTGSGKGRRRGMYNDGEERDVSCRFIFISNHEDDFPVDENDRRVYKARSDSKNHSLKPRIAALTESVAFTSGKSEAVLASYNLVITEEDRQYARALLFDMFKGCGYEDMALAIDCPYNKTKVESLLSTAPVYIEEVKRFIEFRLFIFGSDIVTQESIRLLLHDLKVKTSLGQVMTTLLEQDILTPLKTRKKKSEGFDADNLTKVRVKCGALSYDEDTTRITSVGKETGQLCYAVRNKEFWTDPTKARPIAKEYKKILNQTNIKQGYSEEAAAFAERNKVVSLKNDPE